MSAPRRHGGLRDHGLFESPWPSGPPTWKRCVPVDGIEPVCPNCKGWLCEITVRFESHPLIWGGRATGSYLGCPACPYASPMTIIADVNKTDAGGEG